MSNSANNLVDFLIAISKRNGWKSFLEKKPAEKTVTISDKGSIFYRPEGEVKVSETTSFRFTLFLMLIPHKWIPNTYLLSELEISVLDTKGNDSITWMTGRLLMQHYAKKFATFRDAANLFIGKCWKIQTPADLEALFRAYDNVADIHTASKIFNLL